MSIPQGPQVPLRGAVDLSSLAAPPAPPVPAPGQPGGAPAASGYTIDVTEESFAQVVESSADHVVIALLWLPTDPTCAALATDLETLAQELAGKVQIARIDAQAYPQIAAAFRAQGLPFVAAIIAGQPLPLFEGTGDIEQIRALLAQVVAEAERNGVTGSVAAAPLPGQDQPPVPPAPVEPPLPPRLQAAQDALEADDLDKAAEEFRHAHRDDPRDERATLGLAQVQLLQRTAAADPAQVRAAAAGAPGDVAAHLAVADLDFLGGHVEDALDRLLSLLADADSADKDALRTRLIDYFTLLGNDDPRVGPARRRLTNALY